MSPRPAMSHPLHRLRRLLALVAVLTAILIAAVCRLEAVGRAIAAIGVAACLVAWLTLLEAEARAAERLEARSHRRGAARVLPRSSSRSSSAARKRRRAA